MRHGAAHVKGLYTYPTASGTQLKDGCDAIWGLGLRTVKLYLTADYTTDYPGQSSWSSTPANLTQLAQTTQFEDALERGWEQIILTCFTFANGTTNWWRANPSSTKMTNEYTEIYNLCVHLLTSLNGTGVEIILQNWEGDWAFMDSTTVSTYVPRKMVDYYGAFLGVRQRAVADARRDTASDVRLRMAVEVNRVCDARLYKGRRRILTDLANRIRPDLISYSAYDSTIVDQGSWGANTAAWEAATQPVYEKALAAIRAAWPGVPIQIGEYGFPENEAPGTSDIGQMIRKVAEWSRTAAVENLLYWEVFDNEPGTPPATYRGYWLIDPNGNKTIAGNVVETLNAE